MAEGERDERDEQDEADMKKDRESAQAAKSLDSLTDHVEEKEMDVSKAQSAMAKLAAAQQASREEQLRREKALASVKITPGDVDIIANEFEVDKKRAERRLREHDGNVVAALESFL